MDPVFARYSTPDGRSLALLSALGLAGALGCLPGSAGAFDPVSELAWLTLLAPAAGTLLGGSRVASFPFGLAVPALWILFLVLADAQSPRDLPAPQWAAAVVAGLFGVGLAAGRARPSAAVPLAGAWLLVGLLGVGLALGLGLDDGSSPLAQSHPRLASWLLDLSPLTLAFDCAGWDWTHAQPEVYARSGVEWFGRRPYAGNLAGPTVLVVGSLLAWLCSRATSASAAGHRVR